MPYDQGLTVETWWDLGMDDSTAIWFTQRAGIEWHIIDYLEDQGEGLVHYVAELTARKYLYATHHLPPDAKVRELGTGKSRMEVLQKLGLSVQLVPSLSVEDGIESVRMVLPRCWFDEQKCERGLEALRSYRRDKGKPLHDWSSHAADGFRYFAVGSVEKPLTKFMRPERLRQSWLTA